MIPRFIDRALFEAPGAVGAYYNAYKTYRWGDPYIRLVASLADGKRWAVDVGAHLGDYTFFMRRHAARCVAFECNPALVQHLRRRFAGSIDLRPEAVSDQAGTTVLRIPQSAQGIGLGRATIEASNPLSGAFSGVETVSVPMVRLDDAVTQPVGLIKVDVEGHEMSVLRGATRILSTDRPNLVLELEERHKPGCVQEAFEYLRGFGYRGSSLQGGKLMPVQARDAGVDDMGNYVFIHDGA